MPPMRRIATALIAGSFVAGGWGSFASAAEKGVIRGRVINQSTDSPESGVRVTLTSSLRDGSEALTETTTTDGNGRYVFRSLSTGANRFYALDARFEGGLFAGGAITLPDDTETPPVITSTLNVWPTTTDPRSIVIRRDDIFATVSEGELGVIESLRVVNIADQAYVGRGEAVSDDEGSAQTLGFAVPPRTVDGSVVIADSDLDIPQLVPADFGFAATIAIPPGQHQITFGYRLAGTGGSFDLSRVALYPTLEFTVHATEPLTVESNRLSDQDQVDIEGRTYERWGTDDTIEAGDQIQALAIAQVTNSAGLMLGLGLGLGGLAAMLVVGLWMFRRRSARPVGSPKTQPAESGKDELVAAIAELDVRYRAGEIDREEWSRRRADLMARADASSA